MKDVYEQMQATTAAFKRGRIHAALRDQTPEIVEVKVYQGNAIGELVDNFACGLQYEEGMGPEVEDCFGEDYGEDFQGR